MASSTTSPIASTSPKRVSVLMENPSIAMKVKVPTSETGIVISGISIARQFWRKIRITSKTRIKAVIRVSYIPEIEALINSVVSRVTLYCTPSGK